MNQAKLYVGNLSYETSEASIRTAFEAHGEVASAQVITDRDTGRSRGFAFVEFTTEEEAQAAQQRFDGMDFGGRNLRVNEAQERRDSPRGGGRRNRY